MSYIKYKYLMIWCFMILLFLHGSTADCPEEILQEGIEVIWPQTSKAENVTSIPLCYVNNDLVSRDCNGTDWDPPLFDLTPCTKVIKQLNYSITCPPGSNIISRNNSDYCFVIEPTSSWNDPCFSNGAGTVITDLTSSNIYSLLNALKKKKISRYFWLPAKRPGIFLSPMWTIPGPNYGKTVKGEDVLNISLSLWKNCVALDIDNRILTTETCSHQYPSMCLFINGLHHPAKCLNGYYSFRYSSNYEKCYGIEFANDSKNATFNYLREHRCATPMGDNDKYKSDFVRFLFQKVASFKSLPQDYWCWFANMFDEAATFTSLQFLKNSSANYVVINNQGTISLKNSNFLLPCMACETDVVYGETKLTLEYNEAAQILYLTVYYPSGLWLYENGDKGIQCFSNVNGPVNIVDINDAPVTSCNDDEIVSVLGTFVEKIIYTIELPRRTPAEYWCIGHTKQFTSIYTEKIVINPQGSDMHVFSLVFQLDMSNYTNQKGAIILSDILANLNKIFHVDNIVIMAIVKQNDIVIMAFVHLQSFVDEVYKNNAKDILTTYSRLKLAAETHLPDYNYTFVNMSSATHCLPDSSEDIFTLQWDLTPIGHMTIPKEFCLQYNGLPVIRYCNGSYTSGGYWGNVIGNCIADFTPSTATKYLYNFVSGQLSENYASQFLTVGLDMVLRDVNIIIPADVYFLAVSLEQVIETAQKNDSIFEMTDLYHMSWVMDRIMSLNINYLRLAQTLNSTNMILDTVDNFIELLSNPKKSKTQRTKKYYQRAVQPKFIVQISNPYYSNITGVAISKTSDSTNFTDMLIQPLFRNTSIYDVMSIKHLEIATWLPENLLLSLTKNVSHNNNESQDNDLSLIITVFYDDSVFQQLEKTKCIINSRIIGVSIPGYYSNFKLPMPLLFKDINFSNSHKHCVFWDFNQHNDNLPGLWSENGCYFVKNENDITICECYHLTHFGNLIFNKQSDYNETPSYLAHMTALNIISLVGCFLSLSGIIGIWVTALVFQTWRKKPGTKILLHLSVSIAMPLVIFVVFNLDNKIFVKESHNFYIESDMKTVCIILGVMIHYSIIASFLWMLITAILQFIRYVRVLGITRPKRFTVKLSLIAWGLPTIPVTIVLLVDKDNYIPIMGTTHNSGLICYPHGMLANTCVTLPVCIILVINILIFIRIIYAISRGPDGMKRKSDIHLVYAQMRLSILLFFLLGLTWTFGLFSFSNNYLWSYLFCLTSTTQGLVLFIYFVVCDPSTRKLWVMLIKPQFVSSTSRESITSTSF